MGMNVNASCRGCREDGRSNYALDLEALNTNLMTYSRFGDRFAEPLSF
jgi:hypothetical protein